MCYMYQDTDFRGGIKPVEPIRIERVISEVKPVVVSVRGCDGNEMLIANISVDVRTNGVHIILDCPEAVFAQD